ncbi:MAG: FG-GAP repeat protein [Chloroflexi bacterium]|nr:FG-GAP repeat protein [Chloroflexota bacterium]
MLNRNRPCWGCRLVRALLLGATLMLTGLATVLAYPLATGDFNGDGRLDLAIANQSSGAAEVLRCRAPTGLELSAQLRELSARSRERVVALLVSGDEYFTTAGGTNRAWVERLHRDLLGHPVTPFVLDLHLWRLEAREVTRRSIAEDLLGAPEYRLRVVQTLYRDLLGVTTGLKASPWLIDLLETETDEVIARILGSRDYFARPCPTLTPTPTASSTPSATPSPAVFTTASPTRPPQQARASVWTTIARALPGSWQWLSWFWR